jgi:uncharacterized protein with FMN-binding domain
MRRAIAAVVGTVAGLAALLHYKSGPPPTALATSVTRPSTTTTTVATTTLPPSTAPTRRPTTTVATIPITRTVDGPTVENRYGPVQVEVTVSGGRLLDVQAIQLPQDRPRSAEISDVVAPILRREALARQGAAIDAVSGATYTSQSYAQSLQAAIDQARR